MLDYKYLTIASRATTIRSADHTPDGKLHRLHQGKRSKTPSPLMVANTKNMDSTFTPIRRANYASATKSRTQNFWVFQQPNKALEIKFSDRVRCDKMSGCHDHKDYEGKTPRSVLCVLVLAQECALLVNFHIHDMKKIPVDALGTLNK
jgi:hypothetical protein